jgi:hypothetical protein
MVEVRGFKDSNTGAPAKHGHIGEKKRLNCRDLDDSFVFESMFEKDRNRVLDGKDRALRVAVLTCHLEARLFTRPTLFWHGSSLRNSPYSAPIHILTDNRYRFRRTWFEDRKKEVRNQV